MTDAEKIEAAIRQAANKPTGELTKVDLEKVTWLNFSGYQLTDVSALAGLKQLKLLDLQGNPNLTKLEIDKLQNALPNCAIRHNAEK